MQLPPGIRKISRFFLALLAIYFFWSVFVNVTNLDHRLDDEALVACLFYLPPLGILGIGIVLVKIVESAIFMRLVRMIRNRFRKK